MHRNIAFWRKVSDKWHYIKAFNRKKVLKFTQPYLVRVDRSYGVMSGTFDSEQLHRKAFS